TAATSLSRVSRAVAALGIGMGITTCVVNVKRRRYVALRPETTRYCFRQQRRQDQSGESLARENLRDPPPESVWLAPFPRLALRRQSMRGTFPRKYCTRPNAVACLKQRHNQSDLNYAVAPRHTSRDQPPQVERNRR